MSTLDQFRPYVQPSVPGCPLVLVDDTVLNACRKFSEDSWLITEDLATINTVASTQSYTLTPAQMSALDVAEVFGVKTVIRDGVLSALSPVQEVTAARYVQALGTPTCYWFADGKLYLYPTPDRVYVLTVEALTRPLQTATIVSSKYIEYRDPVTMYAKFVLMDMAGKPWTNPDDARANYAMYAQKSGEQQRKQGTGRVAAPLRVAANFF